MTESVSESSAPILSNSTMKKSIKILHVDDDPSFLKVTKQCLETQGEFEVDTASSVNEALGKLEKTDYDAVVSDYQMSGKDGIEFLKELREKGNTVPFIVFTGKGREEIAVKALNLGADQYIDKHGDPETVYYELAHALSQAVDRRSTQIESLKREAKLEAILESSPEAITVTDLNGNIIEFNQATVALHGYESKEELIGKNSLELIAKQDHKRAIEGLKETLEHGSTKNLEYTFLTKDGREFQAELSASVVRDASGKPEYFMAITKDITDRKKAEEALRENRESYRELAESISDMFFAMDKDFRYTYWNQASEKFTGVSAKDAVGKSLTEVFPDVKGTRIEQFYKEALRTQQPQSFLNKYQLKGKDYVFELNAYPTKTGLSVFVKDVTERQKMDDEIKSLARFPSENPNPVLRLNREGNILYANNPGKALLQDWKHEVADRTPEFLRGVVAETLSKQSEKSFDLKLGKRVYSIMVTPVMGSDYANIYGTDITERKKAGEELFDELSLMQLLLGNHPDFIYFKDSEARFQRVSKRFCDFFELDKEDIIGRTDLELFPEEVAKQTYSEDLQIIKTGKSIINKEENAKGTWVLTTKMPRFDKDGKIVGLFGISRDITDRKKAEEELKSSEQKFRGLVEDSAVSIATIDLKGRLTYVNKALADLSGYSVQEMSGRAFKDFVHPDDRGRLVRLFLKIIVLRRHPRKFEFRALRKDGAILHLMCRPTRLETAGKTVGFQAIVIDNTAEKHMLDRAEKMNEKLSVVGGLTRHDVNNKLSTILSTSYLLKQRLRDNQSLELVKETESAVHQIEGLFEFARIYEKLGTEELVYVDAEKVFNEAARLFPRLKDIKIVNDCHGLTVFADSLLRQLFYNLVDNSLKHGEKPSRIRVFYEEKNDHLNVIYEDDGVGIPQAAKPKLFDEGYTTGKGSSHGLYLVKKMMEVYGWTIQETGMPSKGAKFTIIIPRTNQNGKENYRLH